MPRRYITNDTTYEKLGEIHATIPMASSPIAMSSSHCSRTLDREEYAAARGFYLTGWAGKSSYQFDRIIRGNTHIPAVCISLIGTTQPSMLAEYMRRANSGGAGDDGLIQRFGLLVWPDEVGAWKNVDEYANSEARQNVWDIFVSFGSVRPAHVGAKTEGFDKVPCLRFDDEAAGIFLEWRQSTRARPTLRGNQPALQSHFAKYREFVPTLALLNQLADVGSGDIDGRSMGKAIAMAEYLRSHAKRAYASGPEAETAAAKAILGRIQRNQLEMVYGARSAPEAMVSPKPTASQIQAGLNLLCDLDWLRSEEQPADRRWQGNDPLPHQPERQRQMSETPWLDPQTP